MQENSSYTKVPTKILEALSRAPIGNSTAQVFWAIIRKTYGWHKSKDQISIGQLAELTGCSRRTIIYQIQNLESKKIILVERVQNLSGESAPSFLGINENVDEWVVQENGDNYTQVLEKQRARYKAGGARKLGVVQGIEEGCKEIGGGARNCDLGVQGIEKNSEILAPTKDTSTKETITKENYIVEFEKKPLVRLDRPEEIFSYWQQTLKHPNSKLDKTRRKAIEARLAEGYSLERIKQAIRGINFSPHHMGQNDRNTVYDDIELICRNGKNVDRFADMENQNAKSFKPNSTTGKTVTETRDRRLQILDELRTESQTRRRDVLLGPGDFTGTIAEPANLEEESTVKFFTPQRLNPRAVHEGPSEVLQTPQGSLPEYELGGIHARIFASG